jgi:hypothetical protein
MEVTSISVEVVQPLQAKIMKPQKYLQLRGNTTIQLQERSILE